MRKLCLFIVFTLWIIILNAQSPLALSLEKCIQRAEKNSFILQSDMYKISATESAAAIKRSRSIPRIGGELTTQNMFLQPYYFNQVWASVHVDWSLGDMILQTSRSSTQDIETRRLENEQNRLNIIGQSTSLYMSILQVNKQIEILQIRLELLQKHCDLTRAMWKAGIRTQLDVLQTESEIVKLQEDSSRLVIVGNNLSTELAHILGWKDTDSLRLLPIVLDSITAIPVPPVSLEQLFDNPILASFDSKVKAQQFRTNEVAAGQIPHLKVGGGYFTDGDPTGDGNYWGLNAGIVIPIYYGHEFNQKKHLSEAIVGSLDARKQDAERKLMIHLFKVYEKMARYKDLLNLQNQRQAISANAVSFAELNYRAGISSNIDFISAQQRLTNTQLSIEETLLEYTVSLIEYYIITNQVDNIIALGNIQNKQ